MPAPFPHEFSDTRYRKALKGLFKAGTGVTPPKLAGRDTETTIACDALLNPLQDNSAPARDLVIYGPRGNGKTVLLADFKRRAAEAGISALMLTPDDIDSPAALIRTLLLAAPTLPDATAAGPSTLMARLQNALRRSGLSLERVTLDGPGISAALSAVSDEELAVHALAWLTARCRTQPLLVTVDEAHTLDVGIGRRLLNISQKLRATGAPFVLILAGTPNLEAHKAALRTTLCAGLGLEEAAATAALEQLAALGYTWQTTTATDWFEPGIPSLMTHVQTRLHDTLAQTEAPRP